MAQPSAESLPIIFTIEHSTRTLETFVELLRVHGITHMIDVRTVPRSRHNPQCKRDALPDALKTAGIRYTQLSGLGRPAAAPHLSRVTSRITPNV